MGWSSGSSNKEKKNGLKENLGKTGLMEKGVNANKDYKMEGLGLLWASKKMK